MQNRPQERLNATRARRARRTRAKIRGTASLPRLSVFRTARHISVQIIDDATGKTLASASDEGKVAAAAKGGKIVSASEVGKRIAEAGKKAGVTAVVFDRGRFAYHGRVKALAEAARENGLTF